MSYYANNKEDGGSCVSIIASSNTFSISSSEDEVASPPAESTVPTIPTKQLSLDDDEGCFLEGIHHGGCKVLGKAWAEILQQKITSTYTGEEGGGFVAACTVRSNG
jgi:hypothetical protein